MRKIYTERLRNNCFLAMRPKKIDLSFCTNYHHEAIQMPKRGDPGSAQGAEGWCLFPSDVEKIINENLAWTRIEENLVSKKWQQDLINRIKYPCFIEISNNDEFEPEVYDNETEEYVDVVDDVSVSFSQGTYQTRYMLNCYWRELDSLGELLPMGMKTRSKSRQACITQTNIWNYCHLCIDEKESLFIENPILQTSIDKYSQVIELPLYLKRDFKRALIHDDLIATDIFYGWFNKKFGNNDIALLISKF